MIEKSNDAECDSHYDLVDETNQQNNELIIDNANRTSQTRDNFTMAQNKEFNINEATQHFDIVQCTENPYYGGLDDAALKECVSNSQNTQN